MRASRFILFPAVFLVVTVRRIFQDPPFRKRLLRAVFNVSTAPLLFTGWCATQVGVILAPFGRLGLRGLTKAGTAWNITVQFLRIMITIIGAMLAFPFRILAIPLMPVARLTHPVFGPPLRVVGPYLAVQHPIGYSIRRIFQMGLIFLVISFSTFMIGRFGPGDPVMVRAHPGASPQTIERLRENLGFNEPILMQYVNYMAGFFQGDLGRSVVLYQDVPVAELLAPRLAISVQLGIVILPLIFGIGMAVGIFAALRHRTAWDPTVISTAIFFDSIHPLIFMPVLILLFVLTFPWLPAAGWDPIFHIGVSGFTLGVVLFSIAGILGALSLARRRLRNRKVVGIGVLLAALGIVMLVFASVAVPIPYPVFPRRMWIPVMALTLPGIVGVARLMRISILNELGKDYVRTARSKGLPELVILLRHALRNAMLPMWTVIGLSLVTLVSGSFFVEFLYGVPGLGRLALEAVFARDYDIILAITFVGAAVFLVLQLVVDIGYSIIDPRIRLS